MFGFGARVQPQNYEHKAMSVEEMRASGGLIVDIRTSPEWFQTGVIEGATLATFHDPNGFLAEIKDGIADGRDVILVCRSGSRTQAAGTHLAGLIPNKVISAAGGMIALVRGGYQPVAVR